MQQPPPYGQGQPGYGQHYPQQPGYPPPQGYPGYGYGMPMPPPKKKRTGLVLGIVGAVVVLLGVGIPGAIFASEYFSSTGAAPSSSPVPAECQVPAQTLEKAGFPSFALGGPGTANVPGLKQVNCSWKPGTDENVRDATLSVRLTAYSGEGARESANHLYQPIAPAVPPTEVKGVGDKALLVRLVTQSAFSGSELHILKGTTVVIVEVSGWDKGFFSNSPMPQQETDDAVKAVGTEVVKKLGR